MVSADIVALLDEHSHRMPLRENQIIAIGRILQRLRQTLGPEAANATPQYRSLLAMLRAHTRPMPGVDATFAQVQAVRLQVLAEKLLREQKPFPPQLVAAIREGLVSGFDPITGLHIPAENQQPASDQQDIDQIPWEQRTLPVRYPNIQSVMPFTLDPSFLNAERDRILFRCMSATAEDVTGFLKAHEASSSSENGDESRLDLRTAALLEARLRHVRLVGLQRSIRGRILEENALAEKEGRRGSKPRLRSYKQLLKEVDKIDRARARREEAEERESRKRQQLWINGLTEHSDRFRRYHRDVVRRGVRAMVKSLAKYHDDIIRNACRAERDAERVRIQKLKEDDEEGYLKLVKETKNTRLLEILNQTDQYLKELGAIVKEERVKTGEVEYEPEQASEIPAKHRYYDIAHAIKEEVKEQPSLLVGGKLKEYQVQGIEWMVSLYNNRLNGILADEMGLGKTIQTLGLITYLMETKENSGPYLIIVPLSTISNWELEFAKWAPAVTVVVFKGDAKNRRHIYETVIEKNKFNVCLATYEYVVRGKNWLKRVHWQHIIIDEGHRIKNHESRLSVVLHTYYTSRSRLLLTGTPLQNSLTELWALLNFLLPNVFKSAESFESWFAAPFAQMGMGGASLSEQQTQLTHEESLLIIRRLHQVLRPFLLRRLKADVLRMGEQLPDKQEHIILCDMSAWQRKMYVDIVKSNPILFTDSHGRRRYDRLSNPAMQLRKCVNHPYLFHQDHSSLVVDSPDLWRCAGKFDMLDGCIMKFLKTGHRILIFNQMSKVVDLQARLLRYRKIPFYRLDGSTPPEDRKRMVSNFNDKSSNIDVFLLTTRAGGLGVNLQTADTVIIFDSDWNPSMDQQAQDRAHRIGQQREVLILRMITAKSVEELVMQRASFKRGLEEKIIRAGMFDHNSKDSERQAMLRELLSVQEAGSDGEDGEDEDEMPTEEEINRLLARSEEEYEVFSEIDRQREMEKNGKPRLFTEAEIPDFAVIVPKDIRKRSRQSRVFEEPDSEEEEDAETLKPRSRAAKQNISYGVDTLTDRQYIELLEKSANGEVASMSDGVRTLQSRKRQKQSLKESAVEPEIFAAGGEHVERNDDCDEREGSEKRTCNQHVDEMEGAEVEIEEGEMTPTGDNLEKFRGYGEFWPAEGRKRPSRITETDSDDERDDNGNEDYGLVDEDVVVGTGASRESEMGRKRPLYDSAADYSLKVFPRAIRRNIIDEDDEDSGMEEGEVVEDTMDEGERVSGIAGDDALDDDDDDEIEEAPRRPAAEDSPQEDDDLIRDRPSAVYLDSLEGEDDGEDGEIVEDEVEMGIL